jgi:hypothetical protein
MTKSDLGKSKGDMGYSKPDSSEQSFFSSVIQKLQSLFSEDSGLSGDWITTGGTIISFSKNKGVYTKIAGKYETELEKIGKVYIGFPAYKKLKRTGEYTWTSKEIGLWTDSYETFWVDSILRISPDGQTIEVSTPEVQINAAKILKRIY